MDPIPNVPRPWEELDIAKWTKILLNIISTHKIQILNIQFCNSKILKFWKLSSAMFFKINLNRDYFLAFQETVSSLIIILCCSSLLWRRSGACCLNTSCWDPTGGQTGHYIYTLSTHYLHTIYTLSTHYLHIIYTLSTHYRPSNLTSRSAAGRRSSGPF